MAPRIKLCLEATLRQTELLSVAASVVNHAHSESCPKDVTRILLPRG